MKVSERGKCPHCLTTVQFVSTPLISGGGNYGLHHFSLGHDNETIWIDVAECPSCSRPIMTISKDDKSMLRYPLGSSRAPAPAEVPSDISRDYNEAALVLPLSPKASAALSRRCLQAVLRDTGKTKKKDLADQIDEVLPALPSQLQKSLDAIRNIGNFAAHPTKSTVTGEIVEVEPNEAEWNLDVIEALFDFYYVQPSILEQKRKALDEKLKQAGKPRLK